MARAVDHSAAWLSLKEAMQGRQGIGRDALLALMGRLEAEHSYDEANLESLMRRAAPVLGNLLRVNAEADMRDDQSSPVAEVQPPDGMTPAPAHRQPEGGHDGHRHTPRPASV